MVCCEQDLGVPTSLWGIKLCYFLCYINIEGGGHVCSETSVCMEGLLLFFHILIAIDILCVANKTQVSTTMVKVTVGVQTLSFLCRLEKGDI
jgi:putative effector of murein hydrolase LrgA (UPF0299 family)